MTSLDQLQFEATEKTISLRNEQWVHLVTILEVQQGGQGIVHDYLVPDLQKQIMRQLFDPEASR